MNARTAHGIHTINMKKVLVPLAEYTIPGQQIPMHFARETYIKKLVKNGLIPVFVSSLFPLEMVDSLYDECGGVICMGGSDISPEHYHTEKDPKTIVSESARDVLELRIIKKALADKKPYLGICRGHQALAIASGGSLVQDISDAPEPHTASSYDDLYTQPGHDVMINESTRFYTLIGKKVIHVNSAHHQAVEHIGENLVVSARSPDGIIEAMEHTDSSYFCYSVQCHPEAMQGDLDILFSAFSNEVHSK